ncbi:hypothetical protein [Telmatospirillum sp.]|uniref:hypothetical protein n=1 Tax=Telmatospirillum sp. TaxID=2079197 RepID=UPI0028440E3C|nr:hypothetical protein [Telmatospirillum sp.]MDR3435631.1 hypothetical protein [Telmatospirillum sp.]
MAGTASQTSNSIKSFEELTQPQRDMALSMFAQLRPHTEYSYEIDLSGNVRCRRYNGAVKAAPAKDIFGDFNGF